MKLKLNDLYKFSYNDEYRSNNMYSNHCFDGQLLVKAGSNGLILVDTYWGSGMESKTFTLERALDVGVLNFVCNLDDVEEVCEGERFYYEEEDFFNISSHHGYSKKFVIKKGAVRSKEVMLRRLKYNHKAIVGKIRSLENDLNMISGDMKKVLDGDLNVYIQDI